MAAEELTWIWLWNWQTFPKSAPTLMTEESAKSWERACTCNRLQCRVTMITTTNPIMFKDRILPPWLERRLWPSRICPFYNEKILQVRRELITFALRRTRCALGLAEAVRVQIVRRCLSIPGTHWAHTTRLQLNRLKLLQGSTRMPSRVFLNVKSIWKRALKKKRKN